MAILIIDDSFTNLVVLKHLAKGYSSVPAVSFTEAACALDYLTEASSELIIVDCEMPGMNGLDFIEQVRRMRQHANTPILMVTHHTDPDIRMRALQVGSTDFLTKPVSPEEFRLRVRNLLKLKPDAA